MSLVSLYSNAKLGASFLLKCFRNKKLSRNVRKLTFGICIQQRFRSACTSVWLESSLEAFCIAKYAKFFSCRWWRFWSDCAGAQAYLTLRWAHMSDTLNWYPFRKSNSVSTLFCFPFEKKSTLKGKNLLPMGANSFLLEKTLHQAGMRSGSHQRCFPCKNY